MQFFDQQGLSLYFTFVIIIVRVIDRQPVRERRGPYLLLLMAPCCCRPPHRCCRALVNSSSSSRSSSSSSSSCWRMLG